MIRTIDQPEIKEAEKIIYKPIVQHQSIDKTEILRIENEEDFTRIDFIYYSTSYYVKGGWVQISKDTFIRPIGSKQKLKMISAVNIPIAPSKHWFKRAGDMLCYTLYFPPVPKGTKSIEIVECETSGDTWFNFYGVSMERVRSEKIMVGN